MKILIVDDESLALARLRRMLGLLGYEAVTEASDVDSALKRAQTEQFDLALLDINMPGGGGLELARALREKQERLKVIFQTAYKEHALDAFEVGATGYLVKPFDLETLRKNIDRVMADTSATEALRLRSRNGEEHYLLTPEEIYYVQADLTEVILRSDKGFSYLPRKISEADTLLAPYGFVRIHRSCLVNLDKIARYETIEQSKLRFTFEGIKDTVDSSKDGAKAFRNRFSK